MGPGSGWQPTRSKPAASRIVGETARTPERARFVAGTAGRLRKFSQQSDPFTASPGVFPRCDPHRSTSSGAASTVPHKIGAGAPYLRVSDRAGDGNRHPEQSEDLHKREHGSTRDRSSPNGERASPAGVPYPSITSPHSVALPFRHAGHGSGACSIKPREGRRDVGRRVLED